MSKTGPENKDGFVQTLLKENKSNQNVGKLGTLYTVCSRYLMDKPWRILGSLEDPNFSNAGFEFCYYILFKII
jgi:hypothetical protein